MNRRYKGRLQSGFTLIEILITVAIIGIVAAIAVPGYTQYITKANRTDAMNFLSEVAGEQQRYFSQNNVYASDMSDLGYGGDETYGSPEGHYVISITVPASPAPATSYTLSATPATDGRQADDAECEVFTLSSNGLKANTGGTNSNCW